MKIIFLKSLSYTPGVNELIHSSQWTSMTNVLSLSLWPDWHHDTHAIASGATQNDVGKLDAGRILQRVYELKPEILKAQLSLNGRAYLRPDPSIIFHSRATCIL